MTDREDFEKWFWDIYRTNGDVENFTPIKESMFIAWEEATIQQQKIIDELKEELEAWKLQDEVGQIVINTLTEDKENLNKIIDGLQAENKELSEVIERCSSGECYQCDDDNMPRQLMKQIKQLEAENPDVPCPACGGSGYDKNEDFNDALGKCGYCNQGKISKVKALQYENEQLKSKCNNYAKRLVIEGIDDVSFLGSAIVEGKI